MDPVRDGQEAASRGVPETVVGPGCQFEGVLTFRGEAWIEGEFRGQVSARGTLGLSRDAPERSWAPLGHLLGRLGI